ncbi:DUF6907 domain-containing protein [Thermomonospora cellulosilytica]|uniref:Uncharacterized protein n=1 Tax=Thermomonospora cellulosilytica TaxID=1411118 RepID=A0A7W3R6C8_9ACTN|nr:hypothetical protein [Thermomonospora cellulosilytica]MBA9001993.1 hypothetical protein [Thermomonospora cellulosilytica]
MTYIERAPKPGETCSCGRPAVVVYITEKHGDVPHCGIEDGGTGQGDENAPSGQQAPARAVWMPESGCPTWCDSGGLHVDGDAYTDRTHCGGGIVMRLTAEEPLEMGDEAGATLDLNLVQHYREIEPRIWMGRDETGQGTHLSLADAATLIRHLAALLAAAQDEQPRIPGHPIWCKGEECDMHGHWAADREVGPMLAGLTSETSLDEQSVISLIADNRQPDYDRPLTLDEAEALALELLKLVATARASQRSER